MKPTQKSLDIVSTIAKEIKTDHHYHFHILYDIAETFNKKINYVEIGCYAGRSACLMLQNDNIKVISIDIGKPYTKEVAEQNIMKFNIHNNEFHYITGNSHDNNTLLRLKKLLCNDGIDILFIDGGHSYNDVIQDFNMYESLLNMNGYIVFDDYNDAKHSPAVNKAVDYICKNLIQNKFEIIGTFKNNLKAFPSELLDGNCFIIKKY
jgi:predicted O-methyltransferase YrrM